MKSMQKIRILYQDDEIVVVDKPAGYQVHTPEAMSRAGKSLVRNNVMKMVRDQIGKIVFPVHRLDRATSGVLIFALSSDSARVIQEQFKKQEVKKTYIALVRGWTDGEAVLDLPLTKRLDGGTCVEAITHYTTLFHFELPVQTQEGHLTSRYSLVRVDPKTGRLHQIRRHFRKIAHPLIGDTVHGDGKQNRVWRELITGSGLFLKAYAIEMNHPITGKRMRFFSRWGRAWHAVFDQCGFCPWTETAL